MGHPRTWPLQERRREVADWLSPVGTRLEVNAQEGGRGAAADSQAVAAAINDLFDSMGACSRERIIVCESVGEEEKGGNKKEGGGPRI